MLEQHGWGLLTHLELRELRFVELHEVITREAVALSIHAEVTGTTLIAPVA
jgi:hypothetical protein